MISQYFKKDLEILISTMNRDSLDFLIPMFPFSHFSHFSVLIVNQTSVNKQLVSDFPSIRVFNSFEKGLSKSRNLGLQNANKKIVLIADDDEVFSENFENIIIEEHNNFPKAACVCFAIDNFNGVLLKKHPADPKINLNYFDIFNVLSIEISLKKETISQLNCKFDINFGLGSTFIMGEETIYLCDLKKLKQAIIIVPRVIAYHQAITTNDKVDVVQKYHIQGAFFSRVLNSKYFLGVFFKIFFDIRQSKIKLKSILVAIKSAMKGRRDFLEIKR